MRNADFQKLVELLRQDPDLLHDLIVEGATNARLRELLSDQDIANIRNSSKQARFVNILLDEDRRAGRWRDELTGLPPDCIPPIADPSGYGGECSSAVAINPTECYQGGICATTCGSETCSRTLPPGRSRGYVADIGAGLSCDGNVTCSCTTGTCGGSTCSVTCSGDSCGNTCGDSCGTTTNLMWQSEIVFEPWQFNRWRWALNRRTR
jgi:hypothetical protein